jgi:hypothetical protein
MTKIFRMMSMAVAEAIVNRRPVTWVRYSDGSEV